MKKFHVSCIVLGLLLLGFLIWKIGIASLWNEIATLGWWLIPIILLEGVADIFNTLGWRRCLGGANRKFSFFTLFRIRLAGYSINYLTPTATLGGEVTKATLLSENSKGAEAASGVIIGKLSYTLSQLLFVAFGSITILWGIDLPKGVMPALLVCSFLLVLGVLGFLFVQKYGHLGTVVRFFVSRNIGGKSLQKLSAHITDVDNELRAFYKTRSLDLPISMFWHIVGFAIGIFQTWLFLYVLLGDFSWQIAAGIWFLGSWFDLLTFAIPLGIGIQEGTRIIAFQAVGLGPVLGLAYGVTLRMEQIFWAGAGLLSYWSLVWRNRSVNKPPDASE